MSPLCPHPKSLSQAIVSRVFKKGRGIFKVRLPFSQIWEKRLEDEGYTGMYMPNMPTIWSVLL